MDETKRRPRIDWIHTAQNQGEAVRNYTKWDYQPHTIDGAPEAFARAYAVMMTEPRGPIYMCYDAWLQEQKLDHEVPLPPAHAAKVPSRLAPEPKALAAAADLLADPATAIPMLAELRKARRKKDGASAGRVRTRAAEMAKQSEAKRARWAKEAREDWDASPIMLPRLASEVWDAIKGEDWVLTANTLEEWTRMLGDFDKPYRHPGRPLGTATPVRISPGVPLAHHAT